MELINIFEEKILPNESEIYLDTKKIIIIISTIRGTKYHKIVVHKRRLGISLIDSNTS